jgi:ABC-type phosphate/phosphonate transport system substrate-binding protein
MSDALSGRFLLGAVAYDPKVVTIWEGFRVYFQERGLDFDYLLFSNYEQLVESQLAGAVHAAWNSPLAWIEADRAAKRLGRTARAVAMRDTDCDLTSVVVVRSDSPAASLADLAGKRVAVGASDSPQATLIPLLLIADAGVDPGVGCQVVRHDVMVGKHGDHVGGERDAARALMSGQADAACMIDANLLAFQREGTLPAGATRVLATTGPYDHCNFTVLDGVPEALLGRFVDLLMSMSYGDPQVRPLLDLEGLKAWRLGRTSGYSQLERAVDRFKYLDGWLDRVAPPRA